MNGDDLTKKLKFFLNHQLGKKWAINIDQDILNNQEGGTITIHVWGLNKNPKQFKEISNEEKV
jgi:hypothetical protein